MTILMKQLKMHINFHYKAILISILDCDTY
ncbi:DUF4052 family protein [Bacillus pacificus]